MLRGADLRKKRCFVLGLDGMPYSLIENLFHRGSLQNLKKIVKSGKMKRIKSVYPTVSSVAWTCFATGKQPGETNIFGFTEADAGTHSIYIPVDTQRKVENIWEKLSRKGERSIVINVPISYPVKEINGIMVSSFLDNKIKKATYPYDYFKELLDYHYELDADAFLAATNKPGFMKQLLDIMEARFQVCLDLLEKERWVYFQLNIMETDRMFHFFWDEVQQEGDVSFHDSIFLFFKRLDEYIKQVFDMLDEDTVFLLVSDHGFEGVKKEVFLNTWLEDKGYLKYTDAQNKNFFTIAPDSLCFSLAPGRIYFVAGHNREEMVRHIKQEILKINIEYGDNIIKDVVSKEELFQGRYSSNGPELLIIPDKGYDFKGEFGNPEVFMKRHFTGMHTFEDAVILGNRIDIEPVETICDVYEVILKEILYESI